MSQGLGEMKYNFRLYERIKERFGSQSNFCSELGLSRTIVSGIINGRINPSMDEIKKISNLLDKEPGELFTAA